MCINSSRHVASVHVFSFDCISSITQEHMIQSEVSILRRVKHPNIVLLIEEMDTQSELYLVMELVKVGSFKILTKKYQAQMPLNLYCDVYEEYVLFEIFFLSRSVI